jgi:hypothetical protein
MPCRRLLASIAAVVGVLVPVLAAPTAASADPADWQISAEGTWQPRTSGPSTAPPTSAPTTSPEEIPEPTVSPAERPTPSGSTADSPARDDPGRRNGPALIAAAGALVLAVIGFIALFRARR